MAAGLGKRTRNSRCSAGDIFDISEATLGLLAHPATAGAVRATVGADFMAVAAPFASVLSKFPGKGVTPFASVLARFSVSSCILIVVYLYPKGSCSQKK